MPFLLAPAPLAAGGQRFQPNSPLFSAIVLVPRSHPYKTDEPARWSYSHDNNAAADDDDEDDEDVREDEEEEGDDDDNDDYDGNNEELDVADDASSSRTAY